MFIFIIMALYSDDPGCGDSDGPGSGGGRGNGRSGDDRVTALVPTVVSTRVVKAPATFATSLHYKRKGLVEKIAILLLRLS